MDRSLLRIIILYIAFFFIVLLSFLLLPFSASATSFFWLSLVMIILSIITFVTHTSANADTKISIRRHSDKREVPTELPHDQSLKIITLNIAHGRCNSIHQFFHSKKRLCGQLDAIADLIKQHGATIVTLQETDGPTFWSGFIDQTAYIAKKADFPWSIHSNHVNGHGIHYGTSIISKFKITDALNHTFTPTPPTFAKGFTISTIWIDDEHAVDIVSLQLDFSRKSIRHHQINEMIRILHDRNHPLIITGDFNGEWTNPDSVVKAMAKKLQLSAFSPRSNQMVTFPTLKKRFDWILISQELSFIDYDTLHDEVSDHYAVTAHIAYDKKQKHTQ